MADEPTGNLDSVSSTQVIELLRDLVDKQQQTVVMVTHDWAMANRADRIVHLRDGLVESRSSNPTQQRIPMPRRSMMLSSIKIAFTLALRQVRHNLHCATLTLISIAVGVAAAVAVTISTQTTDEPWMQCIAR